MDLLSVEEAKSFLENILTIDNVPIVPVSSLEANERIELLNKIIVAFYGKEPFQSLTLMSFDVDKRHRRSWEDIKKDMFTGQGGLCYSKNTFMFALLTAIGYDARMAHSTVFCSDLTPDNHLVVLICGAVLPDDQYLVEVGCGYPVMRTISLGFSEESPEYTDSFQTFKYVKESDDRILLKLKKPVSSSTSNINEDGSQANTAYTWKPYYVFNPLQSSTRLEDFYDCFDAIFTDIRKLPLQTSPRAIHWPNGKFLGIVESTLLVEDENASLVKTDLRLTIPSRAPSDEACCQGGESIVVRNEDTFKSADVFKDDPLWDLEVVRQHYASIFPQFSKDMVTAALKNWKITGTLTKVPSQY